MKVKVSTVEFKQAIEKVKKVLLKKSSLPESKCVRLEFSQNGCNIMGTDMCTFVTARINVFNYMSSDTENTFVVEDTEKFVKSLKFMNDQEISFEFDESKNILSFSCGNKDGKLIVLSDKECFIKYPTVQSESIIKYPMVKLAERVSKIKYAVSTDNGKPIFQGIHFNGNDMVACDGYRLAMNTDKNVSFDKFTILPSGLKLASEIIGKSEVEILNDSKFVEIKCKNVSVILLKLEGEYFDYNKAFENTKGERVNFDKKELQEGLKYLVSASANDKCRVKMIGNSIENEEKNASVSFENSVPIEICYNPKYMIEALSQFDEDSVKLEVSKSLSPIVIENEVEKALVLPLRMA